MTPALLIAGAAAVTALASISRGEPPHPRIFLGAAIAGAGMLLLANYTPEAAAKLAAVVFTTALLTSGYDLGHGVASALSR